MANPLGFEPVTLNLEGKIPKCCKLGFYKRKPHIPQMRTKWVCGKLGHKHALPIDAPIVLDAIFAFRLWT